MKIIMLDLVKFYYILDSFPKASEIKIGGRVAGNLIKVKRSEKIY